MDSDYGVPRELSDLQKQRALYQPELPPCLQGTTVRVEFGDTTTAANPTDAHVISQVFPHTYGQPLAHFLRPTANVLDAHIIVEQPSIRVGIVFCGRQSPGGHNVIWGLYNAIKTHNPNSTLLGFVGGTEGLFAKKSLEITDDILSTYKNQGGYDLLGRTKDQIRSTEQVNATILACKELKLDGLVIIGGVTSNTDAAQLAETFAELKCPTKVVGVPVTLNGDLKNQFVETNVGFDTICKVNSQLISNVCTDALSAEKYYYFIRLMGRKASHVALECTLQSHPNLVILGEEVTSSKSTIFDITKQICDSVQARAEKDKNHGVVLIPEGLVESIPELYALLQEIHVLHHRGVSVDDISSQLSPWASALFEFLPPFIRRQLLLHPESDDSAQLSQIETEKLLAQLVETEMNRRLKEGTYKGKKFNAICHFFGYQARGSLPSKFDCDYAFVLGHVCYHILAAGLNGYMATITNLKNPVNKWKCGAAPITAMMSVKKHWSCHPGVTSIGKPVIHPATVDLKGKAYESLRNNFSRFLMDDIYRNPGPLQFDGPGADAKPITLCVEDKDYMGRIKKFQEYLDEVRSIVKPGCSQEVLKAALSAMSYVTEALTLMSSSPNVQKQQSELLFSP
ncbi:pyrophosphate--fructose 6-phosphate 1-phosphotransferase subunit alpha-like [Curcuma longa]|uniref:pyrophosphate--fructose 6-phosphate 1-phosphotransferase subunit alpha-like n=1 Tax=Curcuma longa TaxID=136217 RepID=UPI003D9F0FE7